MYTELPAAFFTIYQGYLPPVEPNIFFLPWRYNPQWGLYFTAV